MPRIYGPPKAPNCDHPKIDFRFQSAVVFESARVCGDKDCPEGKQRRLALYQHGYKRWMPGDPILAEDGSTRTVPSNE